MKKTSRRRSLGWFCFLPLAQLKTNSKTNLHVCIFDSAFYASHPRVCSGRSARRLQHGEQRRGPSQWRHTGTGARVPRPGNQTSSFTLGLKNIHFHGSHQASDDSADLLTRCLSPLTPGSCWRSPEPSAELTMTTLNWTDLQERTCQDLSPFWTHNSPSGSQQVHRHLRPEPISMTECQITSS